MKIMRKIYLSFYLFGVLLFFSSFFCNTVPREISDGQKVKAWETGTVRHIHLALNPLMEAVNFINAMNVPEKYGYGERGDGYDWYLNETVKKFFYSIPISVGWFTILFSILMIRQIWTQKILQSRVKYFVIAGSISMLIAVPLLTFDFYNHATTFQPYFYLGIGAYFIVFAYLLVSISLLGMILSKHRAEKKIPF